MTRWEYQIWHAEATALETALADLGAAGWECFQVVAHKDGVGLWLKRPYGMG